VTEPDSDRLDYAGAVPYALLHLFPLTILWIGWSPLCIWAFLLSYLVRMFAITAGYHRYFSHRTYSTSRVFQFVLALVGATAAQNGPMWWAAHHRAHHRHSDTEGDPHSPGLKGFLWAHTVWFLTYRSARTDYTQVRDLAKYPELHFFNRHPFAVPVLYGFLWYGLGIIAEAYSETTRWQLLLWGFFLSTLLLYHATFTINSLAHVWGTRRYDTRDDSRNNFWLALLTLGEGWHNNHHRYPGSERQGRYPGEIDFTHYGLKILERLGLVWDLR
jgi:stearoyl-CoA desaturase (Delta-9 desaturase)